MSLYAIRYTEHQEREWYIEVEAESAESAGELFEANGEDIWSMVASKKAKWATGSNEEGDAVDTYETDWEVEETDEE